IGLDAIPEDQHWIRMFYGWDEPPAALAEIARTNPAADRLSERMLSLQVRKPPESFKRGIDLQGALRFTAAWVPRGHGRPGLFVSLGGTAFRFFVDPPQSAWSAQADVRFDAPFGVLLTPDDLKFEGVLGEGELHADLAIASRPVPPGERRYKFLLGE